MRKSAAYNLQRILASRHAANVTPYFASSTRSYFRSLTPIHIQTEVLAHGNRIVSRLQGAELDLLIEGSESVFKSSVYHPCNLCHVIYIKSEDKRSYKRQIWNLRLRKQGLFCKEEPRHKTRNIEHARNRNCHDLDGWVARRESKCEEKKSVQLDGEKT